MQNTYETIETLGLTEVGASLPIPSDEVLTGRCIGETFEALFAPLVSTGLEGEIEPLAHGLVTVLFRRREALSNALDKETRTLQGLIRCADGSEVLETQLEQSQDNIKRLKAVLDAIDQMAEAAASAYELQTSKAYIPPSGSRVATQAHLTGAVFEAKALLEAQEKEQAERLKVKARMAIAVAGDRDWLDHGAVFDKLDQIRAHIRAKYGEEICLYTKADKKGADAIACAWACSRKVEIVTFQPNWSAHGKRAGFLAVDAMLSDKNAQELAGAVIFGTSGIALNLGQKAEAQDIKAIYVTQKAAP